MEVKSENKTKRVETKFRKLRLEKGLSQKKVAELADLSHSAYVKIESGDTEKIFIAAGKNIAKALGVSFNELFDIEMDETGENVQEKIEQLEKRIIELEEQLNDKRRLVEFLSENNLLLAVASQLYHDENPIPKKRDFNNLDALTKEINEMPYDPGKPESQFRYILKRIDEIKNGIKK